MRTRRERLSRVTATDREAGAVTVFLAISVVGLLVLIGLVADGGAKLRATQRADAVAGEAARAAGQVIDLPQAVRGTRVRVDRQAAANAATAYLTATGEQGTVSVGPDGTTLEVTVTDTAPTVFLGLIGIHTLTVTGHAEVTLVHGVTGGGT
ncbi:pilus assembly protein TadG-related protein [Cellulomonas fimi]|uniref:Putative Flp pilus-assembly TadG-like N-terminal domain-containing protein n=1 Tax=Cellulomonas fimi TaxID=1708 RepID=A0A7Y0LWF9_CELFI|nr:pilus assembly protein TadG-related protein [Cellulomonas fimi]NMR19220.1 hypothetical protein [Cellulomonas fimi]